MHFVQRTLGQIFQKYWKSSLSCSMFIITNLTRSRIRLMRQKVAPWEIDEPRGKTKVHEAIPGASCTILALAQARAVTIPLGRRDKRCLAHPKWELGRRAWLRRIAGSSRLSWPIKFKILYKSKRHVRLAAAQNDGAAMQLHHLMIMDHQPCNLSRHEFNKEQTQIVFLQPLPVT